MSMIQILSYPPLMNWILPDNLINFITNYMTVNSISIPFNLFPSFLPNPMNLLNPFIFNPFNDRMAQYGYISISFIWNFGQQLFTWITLLAIYLLLCLFIYYVPPNKCFYFRRWKEDYEYNVIFRVLFECYLQMSFNAFLNIRDVFANGRQSPFQSFPVGLSFLCFFSCIRNMHCFNKQMLRAYRSIIKENFKEKIPRTIQHSLRGNKSKKNNLGQEILPVVFMS